MTLFIGELYTGDECDAEMRRLEMRDEIEDNKFTKFTSSLLRLLLLAPSISNSATSSPSQYELPKRQDRRIQVRPPAPPPSPSNPLCASQISSRIFPALARPGRSASVLITADFERWRK